ncbi:MAG TPA: MBL fold metallo-hydrolase [Planctomycetes bacterium]|nr:MBL fold metallo-hydrolase [Planctomycetota bacterium]
MRIGNWKLFPVETGRFALDGGAMFGVVPRTLWEKKNPPDERNRVPMALRALLARKVDQSGAFTGQNLLVDTGVGDKWSPKLADIYAVDHSQLSIERGLAEHGLKASDITQVLLTHLHFDHAGGATRKREDGSIVPTFENATYYVQKGNLEWARNPTEKDRASYLPENWEPLIEAGVLEVIEGQGEFLPGIELILSFGHTDAMQLPRFHDKGQSLLYCADLVPTASHIPIPWVMAYDNRPLVTIEEKKSILPRAAAEGWWLFFEHDIQGPAAQVVQGPKGFHAGVRSDLGSGSGDLAD